MDRLRTSSCKKNHVIHKDEQGYFYKLGTGMEKFYIKITSNGINSTVNKSISPEEVEDAESFLNDKNIKSRQMCSSYQIKHEMEDYKRSYVSNGACIIAMINKGYKVYYNNSVNATTKFERIKK